MSIPPPSPSSDSLSFAIDFESTLKQFSLETQRLEMTYSKLQERFKGAEQLLQDSHTRLAGKLAELDFASRYLEAILQHISQGILFIDLKGFVTTYNGAARQILQIPANELLFHPISDRFEDSFFGFSLKEAFYSKRCPPAAFITRILFDKTIELEVEAVFVETSQEAYPLDYAGPSSLSPHPPSSLPTDVYPVQGLLLLLRDITKLRRLQQAANQNDRLKDLGELAAHLAHEIRNPLGGIKGFASLLQKDLSDRPDLQRMASYIAQGADDLNRFVSHVLQYARPFHLEIENVDLIHMIEEIRRSMQADSNWNEKIRFSIVCKTAAIWAPIDPVHFKSALLNIFVNAVQAMPDGGDLSVEIEEDPSWVTLRIADTGAGIPAENLLRIFSPFFTTKETGTGLGLAEVHKVIQAHQGWIEVNSEIGKGTCFTIKIPLKT